MNAQTKTMISAALDMAKTVDPSLTPARCALALAALNGDLDDRAHNQVQLVDDSVLSRDEVAELLKVTPRSVTNWAKRNLIRKVGGGTGRRASGYARSSVMAFIAGANQAAS